MTFFLTLYHSKQRVKNVAKNETNFNLLQLDVIKHPSVFKQCNLHFNRYRRRHTCIFKYKEIKYNSAVCHYIHCMKPSFITSAAPLKEYGNIHLCSMNQIMAMFQRP